MQRLKLLEAFPPACAPRPRRPCSSVFAAAVVGLLAFPAFGQYFGQNKVQYETFDFRVLHTEHFAVYYYPAESSSAANAARLLERWYGRYQPIFGRHLRKDQPVVLYASHPDFQQTNVIDGLIPQGVGGVTEGLKNRIVIPLSGDNEEDEHVLGHELVHAFQYEVLRHSPRGIAEGDALPLWFVEGQAEYLSLGSRSVMTATWMRDAVFHKDLPSIAKIGRNPEYFPYRYGHAIWAYIGGTYGDSLAGSLFRSVVLRGLQRGFKTTLGVGLDSLSKNWQKATVAANRKQIEGRTPPNLAGSAIVRNRINLVPSLSPDGRFLSFLSSRDVFSLDLFLADAKTGKILGKLASQETDQHYDALRFINSSGTWSPDSRNIAFPVYRKGNSRIAILDVKSRRVQQLIEIEGAHDISHVAWSPGGDRLAVSGGCGGISDLFIYTFSTGKTIRLTNDSYSDLQPSWSPNDSMLAFVSDRGPGTDLDLLMFSRPRIVIMDLATRQTRMFSMRNDAKHINPVFSPSGSCVYFISDADGFSDVYCCSLKTNTFSRITRIATGITGLSDFSPAMSIASRTGEIAFSVFEKRNYNIYRFPPMEQHLVDTANIEPDSAAFLPPTGADRTTDAYLLGPPKEGEARTVITPYQPSLGLVYLGQLFVGLSAGRFGGGVAGGISMLFSDMLGDHVVGVAAQIQGQLKDIGTEMVYWNRHSRRNWGFGLSHIPFPSVEYVTVAESTATGTEESVFLLEHRIFTDRISGGFNYPLSTHRRLELTTGITRIDFDNQAEVLQINGKSVLGRKTQTVESPPALDLIQTALAYVGDYSYYGFTSPVSGRRYRFEAAPALGSLFFVSALADYRRYFFPRPFTLAFRLLHIGRYLRDSDSDRLTPLSLSDEILVRGYRLGSFQTSEWAGTSGRHTNLTRLDGSRIAVFNTELRLPLLGNEQFGLIGLGFLPVDLFTFFDAGVAWTKSDKPSLRWETGGSERVPVSSAGLGTRINLMGLLILQIYYGVPFQRPDAGGQWGVLVAPGW